MRFVYTLLCMFNISLIITAATETDVNTHTRTHARIYPHIYQYSHIRENTLLYMETWHTPGL